MSYADAQKTRVKKIIDLLKEQYGNPTTELKFQNTFQLLVSVILSAQCTDERVNKVTPKLFEKYGTPKLMSQIDPALLRRLIFSCGFYNSKTDSIISASKDIVERFKGEVPSDIESLMTLRGVGRKTANVVYAVGFGGQAMPVDTHVFRVSHRLGLSEAKTPENTEKDLLAIIDHQDLTLAHHLFITHGRRICNARKPQCDTCNLKEHCRYYEQNIIQKKVST